MLIHIPPSPQYDEDEPITIEAAYLRGVKIRDAIDCMYGGWWDDYQKGLYPWATEVQVLLAGSTTWVTVWSSQGRNSPVSEMMRIDAEVIRDQISTAMGRL